MRESKMPPCGSLLTAPRSYYILRNDMLGYYVNQIIDNLSSRHESDGWEVRSRSLYNLI
jgi:hypothetical protein